jgi:hypothetical protein
MGMSVGERTQRISALQQVTQAQMSDMQTGQAGVMSDLNGQYQARIDMARLGGLPQPEQYFVDPSSPQAQQAQQQAAEQAQQAQQAQQQQAQEQMQFQYSLMMDMEKIKAESKLQAQQMADQTKQMQVQTQAMMAQMADQTKKLQAHLDHAAQMFGHRVDIAELELQTDQGEAQREIDALQGAGKMRLDALKTIQGGRNT